jgi:Aspartyl/Asparaginyl beta-hydroxylase
LYKLPSKRSGWGFIDLGQVEIKAIKKELEEYHSQWLLDTTRQDIFETHEHTFMFAIRQFDYMYALGEAATCISQKSLETKEANTELENITKLLESAVDGKAIRIEFISMSPNSRVRTHKDRSDVLYVARRFHVPIKTNSLVLFTSGQEIRHLQLGHAYELNNINYHSVVNGSKEPRIHLIIDVLPNEYTENIRFN